MEAHVSLWKPQLSLGDGEEAQRLVLVGPEPVEEVTRRTLLAPTASWRPDRWRQGILGEPVAQKRLIAGDEVVAYCRLEARGSR